MRKHIMVAMSVIASWSSFAIGSDAETKAPAPTELSQAERKHWMPKRRSVEAQIDNVKKRVASAGGSAVDKLEIVLDAMRQEVQHPTSTEVEPWSGYYTATEFVQRQLMMIAKPLLASMPKKGMDIVQNIQDERVRTKLTFIVGELGERQVTPSLLDIARKSSNPYDRAQAVGALNDLGDKTDIELYKTLLNDPFFVDVKSDRRLPPELAYMNRAYVVRREAYSALVKLGFDVIRDKNEFKVK